MATKTLRPSGNSSITLDAYNGGANWSNTSDSSDSTGVWHSVSEIGSASDTYTMDNLGETGATATLIQCYFRADLHPTSTVIGDVYVTPYVPGLGWGAAQLISNSPTTYMQSTSGSWTEAQIDAMLIGCRCTSTGEWEDEEWYGDWAMCLDLWVVVTYTTFEVTTQATTDIGTQTATGNGTLVTNTTGAVTAYGIVSCLATEGDPDLTDTVFPGGV